MSNAIHPDHTIDVVVVGAGPTGLMLAVELALAGVRCRVVDRRSGQANITRAFAVHARTLELLDARGIADDLVPRGVPVRRLVPTPGTLLDMGEYDTRYRMVLIAPQSGTEHLLEARARQLGVHIEYGCEVTGLRQDDSGVVLDVTTGGIAGTLRAGYVVGCDGSHSAVRRLVGINFTGKQYETHILLADVQLTTPPEEAMFTRNNNDGVVLCVPFGDGWYRVLTWDRRRAQAPLTEPVTAAEMRSAFDRIAGTDFGMGEPRWTSRFLSERRQAEHYRSRRVFLAGDAAHVHSPMGGQGMNTGIGDAMNLGWKLAATVQGWAPALLLDSYEKERHPVGETVLKMTDAFNRMMVGHSTTKRLLQRLAIRTVLQLRRPRLAIGGRLTGLGIAYPHRRDEHPWTGRRAPDLRCAEGRLYELLREARFVLITAPGTNQAGAGGRPWVLQATYRSDGSGSTPAAMLVRPDGYIAWAGDTPTAAAVRAALSAWCGPAEPARSNGTTAVEGSQLNA